METVMTPLTNQKLVEALEQIRSEVTDKPGWSLYKMQRLGKIASDAIKEASAPRKEFPLGSGMTKNRWSSLGHFLKGVRGCDETDSEACRMIAEGLSE